MKNEIVDIIDTAYAGNGVGKMSDGKTVFVPFTVTGDKVKITVEEDKNSYFIAKLDEIITPSEHRTTPHCEYYGECGGCQFGHIKHDYQIEIKENILRNALRNHPQGEKLPPIKVFKDTSSNYRVRATMRAQSGQVGFYRYGTNDFIAVNNCPIMSKNLFQTVQKWVKESASDIDDIFEISALESPDQDVLVNVKGKGKLPSVTKAEPFYGLRINKKTFGAPYLLCRTSFGEVPVAFDGFYQSNYFLNIKFQEYASSLVKNKKVLELYAGAGFFTTALMAKGKSVVGIESDSKAVKLAIKRKFPIKEGNVLHLNNTPYAEQKYGCIFVDPPREGLHKNVISLIETISPKEVVYVSCNPMTLARDLNRLSDKYSINSIAMFDMYPHTYHVECVVKLTKISDVDTQ